MKCYFTEWREIVVFCGISCLKMETKIVYLELWKWNSWERCLLEARLPFFYIISSFTPLLHCQLPFIVLCIHLPLRMILQYPCWFIDPFPFLSVHTHEVPSRFTTHYPTKKTLHLISTFSPLVTAQHTTCSNTLLGLLKMGIMMPETCWESVDNKHLTVASCWFSLTLHKLLCLSHSWTTFHSYISQLVLALFCVF